MTCTDRAALMAMLTWFPLIRHTSLPSRMVSFTSAENEHQLSLVGYGRRWTHVTACLHRLGTRHRTATTFLDRQKAS